MTHTYTHYNKMPKINGKTREYFGTTNDGERIYIARPQWDCEWYWSFGYLGNCRSHFHLDKLATYSGGSSNRNLVEVLQEDFKGLNVGIEANIWMFAELVKTAYTLKQTAELLGEGGANYTTNPCEDVILDNEYADKINQKKLPEIFNKINEILEAPCQL